SNSEKISFDIYDHLGNLVKTIFRDKMLSAGESEIELKVEPISSIKLPSATYYCVFKVGERNILTRKMVYVK
ncbi:MAG: hypothetical protein N3A61_07965, partial [Ignavibacteria bacterium]|nr:hypothetical protein [Ignavibacteria bacterium]